MEMKKHFDNMYSTSKLFGGASEIIEYENYKVEINILEKDEISDSDAISLLIDYLSDKEEDCNEPLRPSDLIKYIQDLYEIKK